MSLCSWVSRVLKLVEVSDDAPIAIRQDWNCIASRGLSFLEMIKSARNRTPRWSIMSDVLGWTSSPDDDDLDDGADG